MRKILTALALLFALSAPAAHADSQVFELHTARPEEVMATIRGLYGDQVRVELIRQRLVVVADAKQLAEVAQLIQQVDRLPAPLRLTLSESPPVDEVAGFTVHSTAPQVVLESVEGAHIDIDRRRFGERATAGGWWVRVEEKPVEIDSLALRIDPDGRDGLIVTYSFVRHEQGERRILGNRVAGREGVWIPLLPRIQSPEATEGSKVYRTAQTGQRAQLYLKVERLEAER
jgi:nitrate reductase NapAB chaperone NapD